MVHNTHHDNKKKPRPYRQVSRGFDQKNNHKKLQALPACWCLTRLLWRYFGVKVGEKTDCLQFCDKKVNF